MNNEQWTVRMNECNFHLKIIGINYLMKNDQIQIIKFLIHFPADPFSLTSLFLGLSSHLAAALWTVILLLQPLIHTLHMEPM